MAMKEIRSPRVEKSHPERSLLCEESIEGAFEDLMFAARKAGWNEEEVANALVNLAHDRWMSFQKRDRALHS
ncbi:hypothetical protein ACI2KT_18875 [Ensifer adhaerens]|uniref:hypothetical protein n=1 Tax=Ensifer adhaerens TaxID=106592 RepID=UPI00384EFA58